MTDKGKPDPGDKPVVLEVYKLMVEMADRVSARRQAANSFYLSVNTAILGAAAYLGAAHSESIGIWMMALAGLCVSGLWVRNIESYKELNEGKFHVITALEKTLPVQPFTDEWAFLHRDGQAKKYFPFHTVEIRVPWVFIALNAVQLLANTQWAVIWINIHSFFKSVFG